MHAVEILLIRHALPQRVETDDGSPADPPLSDLGRRQAAAVRDWLVAEEIHAVYTSPLTRAIETATPLAEALGIEPVVADGVAEFDRDHHSYVPMEELRETDHAAWLLAMQNGGMPPEADPLAFRDLVVASVDEIIVAHPGQTVAVFCHGGVVNAYASHLVGKDEIFFFEPIYTSISRFRGSSAGHRSIVSLNEAGHLRGVPRWE